MRIYSNAYELMSETGRNLVEMGHIVKPKTYQNKKIEGNEEMITREMICEQYCLTAIPDPQWLFIYTKAKEWADKEFEERVSGVVINPGKAWKLRKDMWEQFLVPGYELLLEKRYEEARSLYIQLVTTLLNRFSMSTSLEVPT